MGYIPFAPANTYDLKPNAYGAGGGKVVNQQTVSQYEYYKPQELVQLFARHASKPSWRLMIKAMGFNRGVAAPTTGHFEAPWYKSLVTVGAVTTPAVNPGDPAVITLDAGDMFDPNDTANGTPVQASYPTVGDIILLQDGIRVRVNVKDMSFTPHRLTLSPVVATDDISSSLTVGAAYAIVTNAFIEGSGLPEGRTSRTIRYSNKFQIVKEAASTTGTNLTDQTYWQFQNQPGSNFQYVSWQTMQRFEDACDGALFWGEVDTNNIIFNPNTGIDHQVSGTEGMDTFCTNYGNSSTYTIGSYTMADFDDLGAYYEQQRLGVRDLMCWQGFRIRTDIENTLVDLLNADIAAVCTENNTKRFLFGDQDFSRMSALGGDQPSTANEFAANIGFRAVKKGSFTYTFYSLALLNEYMGAGAPGYQYPYQQYIMPIGFANNRDTGTQTPTFGYEYKELNGISRENKYGEFGGVGAVADGSVVNGEDIRTRGMLSETAFHGTCANHVTIQSPTP